MSGFWARTTGARKAAKEVCTMTALPYRATTQLQKNNGSKTERAANQGPTKLRLENYVFVKNNSPKMFFFFFFRNLLREISIIVSKIIILK